MNPFVRFAVPPSVLSDTVAAPAAPADVTAVTVVAFTTTMLVAATPPIVTLVVPVRFVPVIVIGVPPAMGPTFGLTEVIVGAAMYVKSSTRLAVPPGVVSVRLLAPTAPGGVTAVTVVGLTTVTFVAATPLMVTAIVSLRKTPMIVIDVPPVAGPLVGDTDESDGAATVGILATRKPRSV